MSSVRETNYTHLLVSLADNGVLEVTLNRPEVLNAWNEAMASDFMEVWRFAATSSRVRVVLVSSSGRAFSAGGDFEHLERTVENVDRAASETISQHVAMIRAMMDLDKPIIAAINGAAVGAGVSIGLLCDVTFMSDRAKIVCAGQLSINVTPSESPFLWPLLCSMAKAKYLLFDSSVIDANEAERIGLVSCVVPHAELMFRARAYADRLASRDPVALGWTKRALNHWLRVGAPILDFAMAVEALGLSRPEAAAGVQQLRSQVES